MLFVLSNRLEQAGDLAGLVHVNALSGGNLGQTGHGHDVAGLGHQEAGAGVDLHLADGDLEAAGSTQLGPAETSAAVPSDHRIVAKRLPEISGRFAVYDRNIL